jgi:hypothetical protein
LQQNPAAVDEARAGNDAAPRWGAVHPGEAPNGAATDRGAGCGQATQR